MLSLRLTRGLFTPFYAGRHFARRFIDSATFGEFGGGAGLFAGAAGTQCEPANDLFGYQPLHDSFDIQIGFRFQGGLSRARQWPFLRESFCQRVHAAGYACDADLEIESIDEEPSRLDIKMYQIRIGMLRLVYLPDAVDRVGRLQRTKAGLKFEDDVSVIGRTYRRELFEVERP